MAGRSFNYLRARELRGRRGLQRPHLHNLATGFAELGAMAVQHAGHDTPPLALSFAKTSTNSHLLAVSDEDGFVSLLDTRIHLPHPASHHQNAEKGRISEWVAHNNSIFDVCWIKEDTQILTGSGDQTIKLWDAQKKKCLGEFTGHTGSVKSLSSHPFNPDLLVSGSRDGSFAQWDLRCKPDSQTGRGEVHSFSPAMVNRAHAKPKPKHMKRNKVSSSMSITSVLYLRDGTSVATAGSVDSVVKFWDVRNLKAQLNEISPFSDSIPCEEKRTHGVCSLSQDSSGMFLSASCMDSRVYLYSLLQLGKGPVKSFSGCLTGSFFVKSSISPDGEHILSGSSDGKAYVWQVGGPHSDPLILNSHQGEVTAVGWCGAEVGKMATASDDFTVRIWDIEGGGWRTMRPPSSVRRRVVAASPDDEQARTNCISSSPSTGLKMHGGNTLNSNSVTTPRSTKRSCATSLDLRDISEETSAGDMESPSSVLNPPSSLKRKTICDYFVMA
uniref:Denticleless protein-like protein n=1 Tax=Kalanchoe fedtschenkoi TaxID=63787 RepID=A0A7N0VME9_KALFE